MNFTPTRPLILFITGWATRALSKQHIYNELLTKDFRHLRRVTLFRDRRFAPQFLEEVQQKGDVDIPRFFRRRRLHCGEDRESFAVRRQVEIRVPASNRAIRVGEAFERYLPTSSN